MRRSARIAGLALVGLAVATACSPEHAGAAATVGDVRIGMDTIRTVTAQVDTGAYAQSTTPVAAQRTVLARLVKRQLDADLAPRIGVAIPSEADVGHTYAEAAQQAGSDAALASGAAQNGYGGSELQAEIASETLKSALAERLAKAAPPTTGQIQALYEQYQSQLQGATFSQAEPELVQAYAQQLLGVAEQKLGEQLKVHVNSRFGSWSQVQGTVVDDLAPLSSAAAGSASTTSPLLSTP